MKETIFTKFKRQSQRHRSQRDRRLMTRQDVTIFTSVKQAKPVLFIITESIGNRLYRHCCFPSLLSWRFIPSATGNDRPWRPIA